MASSALLLLLGGRDLLLWARCRALCGRAPAGRCGALGDGRDGVAGLVPDGAVGVLSLRLLESGVRVDWSSLEALYWCLFV